jgi:hypothetical protein
MCLYRAQQHYKCGHRAPNKLIKEYIKVKLPRISACSDTAERIVAQEGLSDIPYCPDCCTKKLYKIPDKGREREDARLSAVALGGATVMIPCEIRVRAREQTNTEVHKFELMFPDYWRKNRKSWLLGGKVREDTRILGGLHVSGFALWISDLSACKVGLGV